MDNLTIDGVSDPPNRARSRKSRRMIPMYYRYRQDMPWARWAKTNGWSVFKRYRNIAEAEMALKAKRNDQIFEYSLYR